MTSAQVEKLNTDFKDEIKSAKASLESTRQDRLAELGVLAIIDTRFWQANVKANKLSKEAAEKHNAKQEMVHTSKRLLAREALNEIAKPRREAKALHKKLTTPWRGEKIGLLSNNLVFQYRHEMAAIVARHDRAVRDFIPLYPALRDEAIKNNGTLLQEDEYPAPESIADRFFVGVDYELLPAISNDIRTSLMDAELEFVMNQARQQRDNQVKAAINSAMGRMQENVTHMIHRLEIFEIQEDDIGRQTIKNDFKRSLITNIEDTLKLMPHLNLFDDPKIKNIAQEMKSKLLVYNFDTLKESEFARETTLSAANEILEQMKSFM